ncbi:MAG: hypothetical protein ABI840_12975 [bacterium]
MEAIKNKRFITNRNGKATDIIIDIKTFEKIQDNLEEFYLIKEYDKSVKKTNEEFRRGEYITWEDFLKKRKKNRLNSSLPDRIKNLEEKIYKILN